MATMVFNVTGGEGNLISSGMSEAEAETMLDMLERAGDKLRGKMREIQNRPAYRVIDGKVIDATRMFRRA